MDSMKALYQNQTITLTLLLSTTFFSYISCDSNTTSSLITSTCNHTLYVDVCMSSLQSHANSQTADLHGLASISINVTISQAIKNINFIKAMKDQLMSSPHPPQDHRYVTICLDDCLVEYEEAIDDLEQAHEALNEGEFGTMNVMVAGAMANANSCENGFGEKKGVQSPLMDLNVFFMKLCSNSMAISNLLS
ncbi:putative invertase inhibitor [Dioscorea cayenensis subsp. rotundata]|uniref:Invertase inhibitor n=1 Tax=Dioscorea cayennensis subsp. rotundata TaxID=55577 RepID=A0AB40B9G4_DIOCR|nr:putative invertase inhibitor [Dioscorea cayenensis subsp. rotundata]